MKFEELSQTKQTQIIKAWSSLINQVASNATKKYLSMDRDEFKHLATVGLWNSFQTIDLKQIINIDNNPEMFIEREIKEQDWDVLLNPTESQKIKFSSFARLRMSGFIVDQLRSEMTERRGLNREYNEILQAKEQLIISGVERPSYEQIASVIGKTRDDVFKILNSRIRHVSNDGYGDGTDESIESIYDTLVDESDRPDEFLEKIQSLKVLEKAIGSLSQRHRYIFDSYYFKDMKLKEIAEELNVNETRVHQILKSVIEKIDRFRKESEIASNFKKIDSDDNVSIIGIDIWDKKAENKKEVFYFTYIKSDKNNNQPEWERIKMDTENKEQDLDIYKIHPGDIYTLPELIDEIAQRKYIFFNAKFVLSLYTHVDKLHDNLSYSDFAFLAQNPQVWGMTKHVDVLDDFKIPKEEQEKFLKKFKSDVLDNNFTLNANQKDAFLSGIFSNFKSVENTKEFNECFNDIFKDFIHKKIGYSTMTPLMFLTAWTLATPDQKDFMQVAVSQEQKKEVSKFPSMFMDQLFPGVDEELKNRGMWVYPETQLKQSSSNKIRP